MKKTYSTINMEKRNYQTPEITVFALDTRVTLMTTSNSLTSTGDATDLYYGGEAEDDTYGD